MHALHSLTRWFLSKASKWIRICWQLSKNFVPSTNVHNTIEASSFLSAQSAKSLCSSSVENGRNGKATTADFHGVTVRRIYGYRIFSTFTPRHENTNPTGDFDAELEPSLGFYRRRLEHANPASTWLIRPKGFQIINWSGKSSPQTADCSTTAGREQKRRPDSKSASKSTVGLVLLLAWAWSRKIGTVISTNDVRMNFNSKWKGLGFGF